MLKKFMYIVGGVIMSLATHAQQDILIYNGPGAGPLSVQNTVNTVKNIVADKYNVITVGPETLIQQNWLKNTVLLIMPGGADRPYLAKLKGQGNDNIKQYVANGGKYLGICAGAYYSADRLEFAMGDKDLEVTGERELKFFPGLITGPTYEGFDHRDINVHAGARAAKIFWQLDQPFAQQKKFVVFYNGGGSFVDAENYANVTVLARYSPEKSGDAEQPAAIVECIVGKGKVILSSPHFEWYPETLDMNSEHLKSLKPHLEAHEDERMVLAKHLLARLDV